MATSRPPHHTGVPHPEVLERARRRAERLKGRPGVPYVGDGVARTVNLVDDYAELIGGSMAMVRFLGELLADQYAEAQDDDAAQAVRAASDVWGEVGEDHSDVDGSARGLGGPGASAGLIGYVYSASVVSEGGREGATSTERVATGEQVRALLAEYGKERDRCAALIKDAMRIGVDLERVEVMRGYAATASMAMRTLVTELGLDMNAEPVLRAAGRAGLIARRALGHDDGDPDAHAGPALTPAERARVLGSALERTGHAPLVLDAVEAP